MLQSQATQNSRQDLTDIVLASKLKKDLSYAQITQGTGLSGNARHRRNLLGQHPLPADAAKTVGKALDLDDDAVALLQTVPVAAASEMVYRPIRLSIASTKSCRSTYHAEGSGPREVRRRHYQRDQLHVESQVEDPSGSRAVITLDGKYHPDQAVRNSADGQRGALGAGCLF